MAITSAAFLVLSLVLAVLFGTQTSPWTWGPAMLSLLVAATAAVGALIKQPTRSLNAAMVVMGGLAVIWFGIRSLQSPVRELGQADLLLLGAAFGGFLCVLAIQRCRRAEWILTIGIAALLLANLVVMVIQVTHPGYRPLLINSRGMEAATGFFTHYNYAANYLLVSSLWLLAQAWMGTRRRVMQIGLGLLGALGLAAIWWTGSRGGLLSTVVALACFGLIALIDAKRRKARWFPAAAIAAPVAAIILSGVLINGWQKIQNHRSHDGKGDISMLMDNTTRLIYLGTAASAAMDHPLQGGGSQSFSWETYHFLDGEMIGAYKTKPEFVHNEWLQAATDYGLIGFLLILGLLAVVIISAVLRMGFEPLKSDSKTSHRSAMRLAGVAGLIAILTQATFSFIIHLVPGALMLGMCLAASCNWRATGKLGMRQQWLQRGTLGILGVVLLILIAPLAWKGSRVMAAMWPSHYSKHRDAVAAQSLSALDTAIEIWPQASLHLQRGLKHHELASLSEIEATQIMHAEKAIADYRAALEFHPYLPDPAVNQANLLSQLKRDAEAEQAYQQAIGLQGGMEPAFRAHYYYAIHLLSRGMDQLSEDQAGEALKNLEQSAEQIAKAEFGYAESRRAEITIHETLGLAQELNGMIKEAMATYQHAATIHYGGGRRIHLRTALLQAAEANQLRLQREPAKALKLYLEARQSVNRAGGQLPDNISAEQRDEFVKRLDDSIRQLRDIGIEAP